MECDNGHEQTYCDDRSYASYQLPNINKYPQNNYENEECYNNNNKIKNKNIEDFESEKYDDKDIIKIDEYNDT